MYIAQLPVTGRPLSQRDGVESLAAIRLPLYRQWCDKIVNVHGIEETPAEIIQLTV
jgi:hypothetical protein